MFCTRWKRASSERRKAAPIIENGLHHRRIPAAAMRRAKPAAGGGEEAGGHASTDRLPYCIPHCSLQVDGGFLGKHRSLHRRVCTGKRGLVFACTACRDRHPACSCVEPHQPALIGRRTAATHAHPFPRSTRSRHCCLRRPRSAHVPSTGELQPTSWLLLVGARVCLFSAAC